MFIPLKYKTFLPVLVGLAGMGWLYHEFTLRTLEDDRNLFGMDIAQTVGDSLRDEFGTLAKFRLEELNQLGRDLGKNGQRNLLQRASSDFRSDVANLTLFIPRPDGTYQMRFETNWELLKAKGLPFNTVYRMDQVAPLDITALSKSHNIGLINRSFTANSGPVGVMTFVLYAKTMDGKSQGPILVADMLAENTSKKLRRSDTVEAFLVSSTGALLAHADPAMMLEYRARPFPGFPQNGLPENWQEGSRFSWKQNGDQWLTMITPTAVPDVYLTSQVRHDMITKVVGDLEKQAWLGLGALVGALMLLSFWMSSGIARNARNIAAALDQLAQGSLETVPKIRTWDEFSLVRKAFRALLPQAKSIRRDEYDRGLKDAQLTTIQTLRATMGNPTPGNFERWEIATHRPNEATSHPEFWDFHQIGNRRQVIIGRANTDGVSGILLSLLVRVTLNNVRRLSDRFTSQRPPTLAETLDLVNGAVFTAFRGRVALIATAFELDLDSGKVSWVQAGGPGAVKWKSEANVSILDEKSLPGQGTALGAQPVSAFKTTESFLAPGEHLFVHAPMLQTQVATGEMAREEMRKTLVVDGGKPLDELKQSLVKSLSTRIFAESFVFVTIRRPGSSEAAPMSHAA